MTGVRKLLDKYQILAGEREEALSPCEDTGKHLAGESHQAEQTQGRHGPRGFSVRRHFTSTLGKSDLWGWCECGRRLA